MKALILSLLAASILSGCGSSTVIVHDNGKDVKYEDVGALDVYGHDAYDGMVRIEERVAIPRQDGGGDFLYVGEPTYRFENRHIDAELQVYNRKTEKWDTYTNASYDWYKE